MPPTKVSGSAVAKLTADLERGWAPVLTQEQGQELLDLLADGRDYAETWRKTNIEVELTLRDVLNERDALREALEEIVKRERRSEYSSIYAAPGEFAAIALAALERRP